MAKQQQGLYTKRASISVKGLSEPESPTKVSNVHNLKQVFEKSNRNEAAADIDKSPDTEKNLLPTGEYTQQEKSTEQTQQEKSAEHTQQEKLAEQIQEEKSEEQTQHKKSVEHSQQENVSTKTASTKEAEINGETNSLSNEHESSPQAHTVNYEAEIEKLQNKIAELEEQIKRNENEQNIETVISVVEKANDQEEGKILQLTQQQEELKEENENLKSLNDKLRFEVEDLTKRLSVEMDNKVSSNETDLENVDIKNRPMKIAEYYESFCSSEWQNCKEYMDENNKDAKEEQQLALLTDILMKTQDIVTKHFEHVKETIEKTVTELVSQLSTGTVLTNQQDDDNKATAEATATDQPPSGILNAISDYMRNQSQSIDTSGLVKLLVDELNEVTADSIQIDYTTLWKEVKDTNVIQNYMSSAVSLVWKMMLQRPPMSLGTTSPGVIDGSLGDEVHDVEVYWGSDKPGEPGCKVVCYAKPALYHSDHIMVKGKVYMKQSDDKD